MDFLSENKKNEKDLKNSISEKIKNFKKDVFAKLDEIFIYIIFFFTPLFFLPVTGVPLNLNKQAFVFFSLVIILLIGLFSFINTGKIKFKKNLSVGLLFLFFITGILSWLMNNGSEFGILGVSGNETSSVINLFILFFAFFLIQSILTTKEKIKRVLVVFVVSSLLTACFWLLSFIGFGENVFGSDFNTIGSLNSFVLFLLAGFFISLAYFFSSKKLFSSILFLITLIFLYFIFIILGFTTSWYLMVFGLIVITVLYFSNKDNFDNKKIKIFFVLFVLVASLIFSFSNLTNKATDLRVSFPATKNIIMSQYESSLKGLFFGVGPAGFNYTFLEYKEGVIPDVDLNRLRFNSGYSALTDYFSDLGFIAGSLFILFLLSVIVSGLKFIFSEMKKNRYDPIFLGLFTAVLILFIEIVQGAQNFTILFFGIALASLLLAYQKNNEKTLSLPEEPQKIFFVLIFILVFVAGLVFISYQFSQKYIAEIYFKKAQDSLSSDNIDNSLLLLNKSLDFYNKDDRYFLFEGNVKFLQLQKELKNIDPSNEDAKKDIFDKLGYIENLYKNAIELNKKEPNNLVALGSLYEFKAEFDQSFLKQAQDVYKKALELDPQNTDILFASGRVYYKSANIKEAKKIFLKLRSLYPGDSKVRVYLGLSYFNLSDKDLALKELEIAKILDPKNKEIDKLINNINNKK
jgi:tetratricopeptide (TPR) repeat protein